jgi:tRNA A-37 threonylcarbamoyl transferase component Bud32
MRGAAHGLLHIHSEGYIHGDISARNVLVMSGGYLFCEIWKIPFEIEIF